MYNTYIKMKIVLYFLLSLPIVLTTAQTPFSLSGLQEPEYHQRDLKLENGDIIFVAKTKGAQGSKLATYNIERWSPDLEPIWQQGFTLGQYENIVKIDRLLDNVMVFSVNHNTEKQESDLIVRKYGLSGIHIVTDTLIKSKIEPWMNYLGKGMVKQGFVDAICSIQNKGYVTPLEYKYYIETSPQKSKVLIYRYDYSKMGLWTQSFVYDNQLSLIDSGSVPIDKGYLCYGETVNDRGDIYIYKVTRSGRVSLVQYNLTTKKDIYLEVHTSSSSRENLKLHLVNDDLIYLAKLNKKEGQLVGLTYSRFDFIQEKKEFSMFHPLNVELKREINAKQQEMDLGEDNNWEDYDLVDFIVDSDENITLFIEKRSIISDTYEYDEKAIEDKNHWVPHAGEVKTGTLLMFSFDKEHNLKWDNYIVKDQKTGIVDGINSISYIVDNTLDNKFRFVYATKPTNTSILHNQINLLEIDKEDGHFLKEDLIENPLKLSLSRPYSFFDDYKDQHRFIFVGRKGLIGKKTFISSIKL